MAAEELYREKHRPQFHFTAKEGWLNDPNGLMWYAGEYLLFFQHNPKGTKWGNMTWGHAVSPDMLHWTQIEHALHPDELGTIFSGSGVVDRGNTAGFKTGDEDVMIGIYTSAGKHATPERPFTQSIACSNDRGRTWTKYGKNPVIEHIVAHNRDPKVVWHEATERWVMALYLDKHDYALFTSPDLKQWTRTCDVRLEGASECPDFFELPVDGDAANTRWVFWGANGRYLLGSFDGKVFTPEEGPHESNHGGNSYAGQTWSNVPESDGRRLQITWMNGGKYPDMPFNQQMSFPVELTLRTTPGGVRLYRKPVREVENIRMRGEHVGETRSWSDLALAPGGDPLEGTTGELVEVRAEIEPRKATAVGFVMRGEHVRYDVAAAELTCLGKTALLPLEDGLEGGKVRLHVLLDRTSIEVFGNDGLVSMPTCFLPGEAEKGVGAYAEGGEARIVSLEVNDLRSAWPAAAG